MKICMFLVSAFCALALASGVALESGAWTKTSKKHCKMELWLGSAAFQPPAAGHVAHYMTPEICQMAAVNTPECVSPKTVSLEAGPKGNCQCANTTCETEASSWLDLYVQTPPEPRPNRTVGKKRGVGLDAAQQNDIDSTSIDGYYDCDDMKALNLEDSWFYNWGLIPDKMTPFRPGKCFGKARAAEFVPMFWSCPLAGQSKQKKGGCLANMPPNYKYIWEQAGVTHLLGFNEPDHVDQSNLPANQAAQLWPDIQMIAAGFDPALHLVAPVPAEYDETGKSVWLDEFFANCTNTVRDCDPSTVEFIAIHDYGGDAQGLIKKAEGASKRYGRKVWITEFADGPWHRTPQGDTRATNDDYLKEVLPLLEKSESVERYAWFASRSNSPAFNIMSNLLPYDSATMKLTSTGKIYAGLPAGKPDPDPPKPPSGWVKKGEKIQCHDMLYLGSAQWPPGSAKDMSLLACEAAAESNTKCTSPKTIAVETGGNGNCLCANTTCVVEASDYLKVYTKGGTEQFDVVV